MLVGMLGANHAGMGFSYPRFVGVVALALVGVYVALFHVPKVGKTV